MAHKINIAKIAPKIGTLYPPPHHLRTRAREKRALGDAVGLTQFGVNLTRLPPGTWSALPHWHEKEDEFVFVLAGTPTLVLGEDTELLGPGDSIGFKAGVEVGHCLQNNTEDDVLLIEIGSRVAGERAFYPGLDLMADTAGENFYYTLDGQPIPDVRRRGPQDD